MPVWPSCTHNPLIYIRSSLGVSHACDWGRGDMTYPGAVRRVVMHSCGTVLRLDFITYADTSDCIISFFFFYPLH